MFQYNCYKLLKLNIILLNTIGKYISNLSLIILKYPYLYQIFFYNYNIFIKQLVNLLLTITIFNLRLTKLININLLNSLYNIY